MITSYQISHINTTKLMKGGDKVKSRHKITILKNMLKAKNVKNRLYIIIYALVGGN